jgi:hypothetical protein
MESKTFDRESTKWVTLGAVYTGVFTLLLDLNASFADLQWVIDAYALKLAALLLTAGSIADIVGATECTRNN